LRVAARPPEWGVRRQDQVGEVEERVVAGIDNDDVADRLLPLTGIDDDLRLAPGLPAVCRLGKEGWTGEGLGVGIVVRIVGRAEQGVAHGVGSTGFGRSAVVEFLSVLCEAVVKTEPGIG